MDLSKLQAITVEKDILPTIPSVRQKHTTIVNSKGKFLLIELPEDAKEYSFYDNYLWIKTKAGLQINEKVDTESIWKMIGKANELKGGKTNFEEECSKIKFDYNRTIVLKEI